MELTIVGGDLVVGGWPRRAPGGESATGLLTGGDLVIGNLEVPLTGRGERAEKLVAMRAPESGGPWSLASWGGSASCRSR